jgi:invasion protein IalB
MKVYFNYMRYSFIYVNQLLVTLILSTAHQQSYAADTESLGDWQLTCEKKCVLAQGLENPNNPNMFYGIQISKIESSVLPVIQFNFPLGIYLPAGVGIIVGDYKQSVPMTVCLPSGCRAITTLNEKLLAAITKNEKINIRFYASEQKPNEVSFSTNGFALGYKKL